MEPNPRVAALISEGLLGDALALLESISNPSLSDRVLRAHLMAQAGDGETAAVLARQLLRERLTTMQRATCIETLSRVAATNGNISERLKLSSESVRLAASGDEASAIPYRAQHCRVLLNIVGVEAALPELAKLKKAAVSAGSPGGLIEAHLITAEIETKREASAGAEAHLASARKLLDSHPHLVRLARWAMTKAHLATYTSSADEAVAYGEMCLEYATKARWMGISSALGNLAHHHLRRGDVMQANEFVRRCADYTPQYHASPVALLGTEMELALLSGNSVRARQLAEIASTLSTTATSDVRYYLLWFEVQRLRWLLDEGRHDEACEASVEALTAASKVGDRNLLQRINVLAAECFTTKASGIVQALNLFEDALDWERYPTLEMHAAWNKVAAQLTSVNRAAAAEHFKRSARIFSSITYLSGLLQVARAARAAGFDDWDDAPITDNSRRDQLLQGPDERFRLRQPELRAPAVASLVLQSATAVFDLATDPLLAGYEVLSLAFEAGAASSGVLVETTQGSTRIISSFGDSDALVSADEHPKLVQFDCGELRGRRFEVVVRPAPEATSRIALTALQRLLHAALALREARRLETERAALWPEDTAEQQLGMVFASENMTGLVNLTRRVATSNVPVLFTGESGTGKELLARALHEASARREQPFVPFNCAAVAKEMLDSQLFGYRRGAFTGAQDAFQGVIRAAAGGTLLLDEIGELSLEVQPKLLRFLESGEVHPLGEPRPIVVDVRIVAATNANLEQLVADGRFREDLFYRLNVVPLHVPPLRERREEIPLLVQHFLDKCSMESRKTGLRFAEETMEYLVLYAWPGNVRQLSNEVRRMVAFAESGAVLMPEHLSPEIAASRRTIPASQRESAPTEFVVRMDQPISAATEHLERSMIQYAMALAGGRVEDAARLLGLSRKGLYLKRQRLSMLDHEPTDGPNKKASA